MIRLAEKLRAPIVNTLLGKGAADETRLEYEKTKVILEWIDKVIAAIHEEKGEVDGELVTDKPQVHVEPILELPDVDIPEGVM